MTSHLSCTQPQGKNACGTEQQKTAMPIDTPFNKVEQSLLTATWLPHGQLGPLLKRQPHSLTNRI